MPAPHPLLVPLITRDEFPSGTVVDMDVVESAEEHGVTALIDRSLGHPNVEATSEVRRRLAADALWVAAEQRRAHEALDHVASAARSLDIELGIFKGPALAALYSETGLRPMIDLDVFVGPEATDRLPDLAEALGSTEPEVRAIASMVCERRVFEHPLATPFAPVDLHRDPMNMLVLSVDEAERWDRTVPLTVGGNRLRTLDLEDTLIQACLHLVRDNAADLLHVNDVRLIVGRGPDPVEVERRAGLNGWRDLVRFATWFATSVFGEPNPLPADIDRWRRLLLRRFWLPHFLMGEHSVLTSLRRQSALQALGTRSVSDAMRAAGQRALPSRDVIAARSGYGGPSYALGLANWRLAQRHRSRAMRAEVLRETG